MEEARLQLREVVHAQVSAWRENGKGAVSCPAAPTCAIQVQTPTAHPTHTYTVPSNSKASLAGAGAVSKSEHWAGSQAFQVNVCAFPPWFPILPSAFLLPPPDSPRNGCG